MGISAFVGRPDLQIQGFTSEIFMSENSTQKPLNRLWSCWVGSFFTPVSELDKHSRLCLYCRQHKTVKLHLVISKPKNLDYVCVPVYWIGIPWQKGVRKNCLPCLKNMYQKRQGLVLFWELLLRISFRVWLMVLSLFLAFFKMTIICWLTYPIISSVVIQMNASPNPPAAEEREDLLLLNLHTNWS